MPFFHGQIEVNTDIELIALNGIDEITYLLNFNMETQKTITCPELKGCPKRAKFSHDGRFLLIGSINAVAIYDLYNAEYRIDYSIFNKKDGGIVDFRLIHNKLFITYPEKTAEYRILSYYEFHKELTDTIKKRIYWCADNTQYLSYTGNDLTITNAITQNTKIITFPGPTMMDTIICYKNIIAYFITKDTLIIADFSNDEGKVIHIFNEHIFNVNFTRTGNIILNYPDTINMFNTKEKQSKKIGNIGPTLSNIEEVGDSIISLYHGDLFVHS
jgi:hypothetical protein